MSRFQVLSDAQWSLIEGMLPRPTGRKAGPFADARSMVEGIIYRCRCGIAWRDLPEVFGPWGRDEQQWLARSVADRKILVIAMEERHVSEWEAFNAAGDARQEHCEAFRNTRPVTSKGSPARVTVTAVKQKETKA